MTGPLEAADAVGPDDEEAWDLETALEHVGVGRFQWAALLVCGLANAADAVEILGLSLVLPAAEDDLALTAAGKSALSSCIFAGMLIGGLLWGPMGDALGRRSTLVASLAINGVFGALSAAAANVGQLVLLRLLAGIGVGGSVPVVFSYLAELLPAHARGKFMVGLAAFWMVGSLYSAGVGWAMIGPVGWRPFLVVAALPAFAAAAGCLLLLPESPRHLLVHGRVGPAEKAIKRMAAVNRVKLPPNVRLRQHESHLLAAAAAAAAAAHDHNSPGMTLPAAAAAAAACGSSKDVEAMDAAVCSSSSSTARGVGPCGQLRPLVQHARGALRTSGMCGGWYSTVLWIPEYFKARGAGDSSLYAQTFAVAAANLPGNIASIFMVDRLGRRWTACLCLAGACLAALGFAAAPADPVWSVVAACVFNAISVGGWNALDLLSAELFPTEVRRGAKAFDIIKTATAATIVWFKQHATSIIWNALDLLSAELFPTEVRSTAMGLLGATGRLASFATTFLAGALMQLQLWAPLVVAAGLLAAGSLAMMLLPEMALKPLEDTVEDAAARSSQISGGNKLGLSDQIGLREISLQGVAASIMEGVGRQRSSSRSGVESGAGLAAAAVGFEEYLGESPSAARSNGRRRFGSNSDHLGSKAGHSKPLRLIGSDPSSLAAAGSSSSSTTRSEMAFKGFEMGVRMHSEAAEVAEEGRSLLVAQQQQVAGEDGRQLSSHLL
ncbi:hypothetical protein OEZ85_004224 [Tetradesmus obliquus]|uniref:Major facilitator superfamily (MFS) profile domain-containing protein n=1 Tax=Tetradesmus obliquus TaxID=3088 RepID=A0ABY8UMG4_TETOB|nr:hypothetical protein OEZ85_004224 [Tetradesmus obliquus]